MIRLCDECGGSGKMWFPQGGPHGIGNHGKCSRCGGTPRLVTTPKSLHLPAGEDTKGAWSRGWFVPDPDTIMWWCMFHQREVHRSDLKPCKGGGYKHELCGWQPRPTANTALEET